jgi:hypothetical protein
MKRSIVLCLLFVLSATTVLRGSVISAQNEPSVEAFWTRFKAAVSKGDKTSVAAMSQFPIGMPYGVPSVRNSAQLIKRYRQVFTRETNAAKCFRDAHPLTDSDNRNRFIVGCKNSAGDEVIVYNFVRTKAGWKFKSLDNINE